MFGSFFGIIQHAHFRLRFVYPSLYPSLVAGFKSTDDLLKYSVDSLSEKLSLSSEQLWRLKRAHEWLSLQKWLSDNELKLYETSLEENHLTSLQSLVNAQGEDLSRLVKGRGDRKRFLAAVKALKLTLGVKKEAKSSSGMTYCVVDGLILFFFTIRVLQLVLYFYDSCGHIYCFR